MLVILSELNNRQYLADRGVVPDYYYADYTAMANRLMLLNNATIVVLMNRTQFNGRKVLSLVKDLKKQEGTAEINKIFVFSSVHEVLSDYYYYSDTLTSCTHMKKSKKFRRGEAPLNFYETFRYTSKNPQVFEKTPEDVQNDITSIKDRYIRRPAGYDGYLNIIKFR